MKFKIKFDDTLPKDEVHLTSHLVNESYVNQLVKSDKSLKLIDPKNNRTMLIGINQVESIHAFTHLSKVILSDGNMMYMKGRLKDLAYLNASQIFRINNSEMINLSKVNSFSVDRGARLLLTCHSGRNYLVSRHYAKMIKERL